MCSKGQKSASKTKVAILAVRVGPAGVFDRSPRRADVQTASALSVKRPRVRASPLTAEIADSDCASAFMPRLWAGAAVIMGTNCSRA